MQIWILFNEQIEICTGNNIVKYTQHLICIIYITKSQFFVNSSILEYLRKFSQSEGRRLEYGHNVFAILVARKQSAASVMLNVQKLGIIGRYY